MVGSVVDNVVDAGCVGYGGVGAQGRDEEGGEEEKTRRARGTSTGCQQARFDRRDVAMAAEMRRDLVCT